MKDKNEETTTRMSDIQKQFLDIAQNKPELIVESLCENDMIKPLVWQDSIRNGGKLGIRGLAMKYNITEGKARWIIEKIEKNKDA